MSGELVHVLGQTTWFSAGTCPADLRGKQITLRSSDGEVFSVEAEGLCMARNALKLAVIEGSDAKIQVPFKKGTVAKVVEYLRYHKDIAPAEIRTPLESENLVECGALKWDAGFVNVDKELLFEVLLAATLMDIPSLIFLAGAKASLLIKGKTPDKLLKDFKMSNDLPEEEEEVLAAAFAAQKESIGATPDDSGLGGVALILNSMFQAAERNSVWSTAEPDTPGAHKPSLQSFRHASWRAMVLSDWTQLRTAPPDVAMDHDLVLAAITSSQGAALQLAPQELSGDRRIVLEAVKHNGKHLAEASHALRSDRGFVLEAIKLDGTALAGASDELQGDQALILEAMSLGQASALSAATPALRRDEGFVLKCIARDAEAFKHAADELKNDRAFALRVASDCGAALQHMPFAFQADRDVVRAAVANTPAAVAHAHTAARGDMGMTLPWDSEPRLAAQRAEQDKSGLGAVPPVPLGSRVVGIPLSKEAAVAEGLGHARAKVQKIVQFSALSTMTANMGQANYIASNTYLDKLPFFERPETDAVTLMWGAVGNIGMRWKAFASADMLNANPEALMSIHDASKVLRMTCCRMAPPEWYAASFFDEWTRQAMLAITAGTHSGGGFRPGQDHRGPAAALAPRAARPEAEEARTDLGAGAEKEGGQRNLAEFGPLGGWPSLAGLSGRAGEAGEAPGTSPEGSRQPPSPPLNDELAFRKGARVMLAGLQAKNGMTGVLLKDCPDVKGKWKVRMDGDNNGVALLNECYLSVIAPPTAEAGEARASAAAKERRQQAMQDRKARLSAMAEVQGHADIA